jgi:hypothetical protein
MIELKCLQAVSERDIDMILVEELQASELFRVWFASQVFDHTSYKMKIGAWHSVSDPALGESDVVFLFVNETDGTSAILIENKINASAQPDQGIRYQKRGSAGQNSGWWDDFKTCLVAPEKYLKSITQTEKYDVEISYEQIQSYFADLQNQDERFAHKALVIEEGIVQNRRGYQPEIDTSLTRFTENYYAFAAENYPDAGMDTPKPRPGGSTWITFRPDCLPKDSDIAHQTTAGFVKLFFRGAAGQFDELVNKYSAHLPDDAVIKLAGKSVAIIMEVPKIADPQNVPFDKCLTEVKAALSAIKEILVVVQNAEQAAS